MAKRGSIPSPSMEITFLTLCIPKPIILFFPILRLKIDIQSVEMQDCPEGVYQSFQRLVKSKKHSALYNGY